MKSDKPIKNRYKGALRPGSENYLYGGEYYMYGGEYADGGLFKKIGAGLYGAGEGILDTLTFGATDKLTDIGYEGLQKVGSKGISTRDKDLQKDLRQQDQIRGGAQIAGAVTGAVINPAAVPSAVATGLGGASDIVQASDASQSTKNIVGGVAQVGSMAASLMGGGAGMAEGIAPFMKSAEQLDTAMNVLQGVNMASSFLPQSQSLTDQITASQNTSAQQGGLTPYQGQRSFYGDGGKLGNKIGKLRKEGYPQDQAVAIAYSMMERNELGNGGYVVSKSDRKGKTHKVTGPDGTVKHFGDPNLKNRPNNPKAKKSWYARHKKNLDKNPHFRAYARATWAEGGDMDQLPPIKDMPIGYQPTIAAYEKFKSFRPEAINIEGVKKGIAHVESADGTLMKNPESTATGLYGQLFSQIKGTDLYSGTRDEFAKDIEAQNRVFDIRLNRGFDNRGGLIEDAEDLYKEYSPQIENFEYSKEDLIALVNFLGRQGTREYLGYHIRDKKPLKEALPNIYGEGTDKPRNKTPQMYLHEARKYYNQDSNSKAMGGWLSKYEMGGNIQDNTYSQGEWLNKYQ